MRTIRGVVTALGTPLDEHEDLHEEGLRRHVRQQIDAGVDALLLLGSMGCMQLLKDETCREAIRVAAGETAGAVPLVVGCGDTSTERTLARIRWAERHPVDGVALVPPFFFKFTPRELEAYFRELAASTSLPVYLYDNPVWTKHALDVDLIEKLSHVSNIVGLKASGDLLTLRRCAERFANDPGFVVLSGQTPFFDVSLDMGAAGIVDGLFAVAPELGVSLYRACRRGDRSAAAESQRALMRLLPIIHVDSVFAGFTAAMNLRGIPGNFAVRPYSPLTDEGRERVRAILAALELPESA
jgi:4-hydroxy-tetrahydrodipicolinate synthase